MPPVKIETLQLLSIGLVFTGFLFAAIGGFGAFHFGQLLERAQDRKQIVVVEQLAEVVSTLQEEQRGLRERIASVEKPVIEKSSLLTTTAPLIPPPPTFIAPPAATPTTMPALALPSPPAPDILLPHLPPVAEGPPVAAPEPEVPSIKPPKLALSPRPAPVPVEVIREEGPLSGLQRSRLIKQLRVHPCPNLTIRVAAENARAVKLALALKSAFREAGWGVRDLEMVNEPLPAQTLLLSTGMFPPPKEFVTAYSALERAGFLVTSDLDPNQGSQRVAISIGPRR